MSGSDKIDHFCTSSLLLNLYGDASRSLMLPRTVLAPGYTGIWMVRRLPGVGRNDHRRPLLPALPSARHRRGERFMRVVIEHALRLPCMSSAALDTH